VTRTNRRLCIPPLIAALCLIIIAGCAGTGRYDNAPRITLADIRVQEIKTLESAFQIGLRVINPNEIPLEISGLECELKLDGKGFATGVSGEHHEIPAYGSAIIPVTVYASMLDMVASAISFAKGANGDDGRTKPLRYELTGHVRLGGKSMLRRTLPFQEKGELSLDGMR
jgi:LEA14-like dessication related protein